MWDYLFFRLYLEAKVRGRVRLRLRLTEREEARPRAADLVRG